MFSSVLSGICSTLAANIPFVGSYIGQACSAVVSLLQSLGL